MKNNYLQYILILLLILGSDAIYAQGNTLSRQENMAKSSRAEKNGWILIHIEGKPEVMGYQHGYLLANEITDAMGALKVLNEKTTGKDWNFFRDESYRLFWSRIPEEYQLEMKGVASGVNSRLGQGSIDIKDVVALNSFIEMSGYYVPFLEQQKNPHPAEHCSAFAATGSWTRDGKIVMAHNNWSEYVVGERWNIIVDMVPEKGNRVVMDAFPGMIHSGDDFNINSAGLIVTETTISGFSGFDTLGVAEFVRARKAIQYASTIDEWVAIMLENNNGGYANDWLLGDNKTGEVARLELGLKNHFLERTSDGYFTGANFPVNEKLIREETSFDPSSKEASPNFRRLRWEELMKENKGKIDVGMARKFMGDHFDMKRGEETASRFTLCGHLDEDDSGPKEISWDGANYHAGAVQAKATDSRLAQNLQFWAIMGHPCGKPFNAGNFIKKHAEYSFEKDYLRDMPGQQWILTGKLTW
jgi:hypothetical protein